MTDGYCSSILEKKNAIYTVMVTLYMGIYLPRVKLKLDLEFQVFHPPKNTPHPADMFKVTEQPRQARATPSQSAGICLANAEIEAL